jgi:hypothetical protein
MRRRKIEFLLPLSKPNKEAAMYMQRVAMQSRKLYKTGKETHLDNHLTSPEKRR